MNSPQEIPRKVTKIKFVDNATLSIRENTMDSILHYVLMLIIYTILFFVRE